MMEQKLSDIKGNKSMNQNSFFISRVNSLEAMTLNKKTDFKIDDHIVICGIINNMRNLILPLRFVSA